MVLRPTRIRAYQSDRASRTALPDRHPPSRPQPPHQAPTRQTRPPRLTNDSPYQSEGVRAITAPVLIIVGDSDVVRLDHVVELFRMLGGGVMGDLAGLPKSQLAVLPGTSHFMPPGSGVLDRAELMLAMIRPFLDAE